MENNKEYEKTIVLKPEIDGMKGQLFSALFLIIIGICIYFFVPKPIELLKYISNLDKVYSILSVFFCFCGIVKLIKLKITISTTKYILTKQRLSIEKGFLSKKTSNLELWRIVDTELKQNFTELSTGGCTIALTTQDLSDPILYIKGLNIKNGKKIYEIINEYVASATKNSGITKMV